MKNIILSFTLLSFLFCASLICEERIASTLENVDLIIEDVLNETGHNFGEKYFAYNRNDFSVRLSIKLVGERNTLDKLIPYTIVIKPLSKVKLGKVTQSNPKEEASWNYEWEVIPDYS